MIYVGASITSFVIWLLEVTGVLTRVYGLLPAVALYGQNMAPYIVTGAIFLFVWLVMSLIAGRRGSPIEAWLDELSSSTGVTRWLDWLIVLVALICTVSAIGMNLLSPYLNMSLFIALAAAVFSMLLTPVAAPTYQTEVIDVRSVAAPKLVKMVTPSPDARGAQAPVYGPNARGIPGQAAPPTLGMGSAFPGAGIFTPSAPPPQMYVNPAAATAPPPMNQGVGPNAAVDD